MTESVPRRGRPSRSAPTSQSLGIFTVCPNSLPNVGSTGTFEDFAQHWTQFLPTVRASQLAWACNHKQTHVSREPRGATEAQQEGDVYPGQQTCRTAQAVSERSLPPWCTWPGRRRLHGRSVVCHVAPALFQKDKVSQHENVWKQASRTNCEVLPNMQPWF